MKKGRRILSFLLCFVMVLGLLPAIPQKANAQTVPHDVLEYEEHYYKIFRGCSTWEEARDYCEDLGGHLATITSSGEDEALFGFMKQQGYDNAYFGLTDSNNEGVWEWVTGEPFDYANWEEGEPNNGEVNTPKADENYGEYFWEFENGTWNDGDFSVHTGGGVDDKRIFICEWDYINDYIRELLMQIYITDHVESAEYFLSIGMNENYGFNNKVWTGAANKTLKFCAYKAWDAIGDAGKLAALNVDGYKLTVDYYEIFLIDLICAMNNQTFYESIEWSAGEHYSKTVSSFGKLIRSEREWKDAMDKEFDIMAFFQTPEYQMGDTTELVLEKILNNWFKVSNKAQIKGVLGQIIEGFEFTDQICGYISTATDVINAFRTVINTCVLIKAIRSTNKEFFEITKKAIGRMEKKNYASWMRDALDDYEKLTNSNYEMFNLLKDTIDSERGKIAYSKLVKDSLSRSLINLCETKWNISSAKLGAAIFTYNATYGFLDMVTGISEEAHSFYLMNYVAPFEKALGEVESEISQNLRNNPTYENAQKYDFVFNLLKNTNSYMYQCGYDYSTKKSYENDMTYFAHYRSQWEGAYCHGLVNRLVSLDNCCTTVMNSNNDVNVYNKDNEVVFSSLENTTYEEDPSVYMMTSNSAKTIVYPSTSNYRVEIIAKEDATIDYYINLIEDDEIQREIEYNNVWIEKEAACSGAFDQQGSYELQVKDEHIEYDCDSMVETTCSVDGHLYETWSVLYEFDGIVQVEGSYCSVCGKKETKTTLAEFECTHMIGENWIMEEPTENKQGKIYHSCLNCGKMFDEISVVYMDARPLDLIWSEGKWQAIGYVDQVYFEDYSYDNVQIVVKTKDSEYIFDEYELNEDKRVFKLEGITASDLKDGYSVSIQAICERVVFTSSQNEVDLLKMCYSSVDLIGILKRLNGTNDSIEEVKYDFDNSSDLSLADALALLKGLSK